MVSIEDLLSAWEERQEAGSPISPEELCRKCPELLEELRWNIEALKAVNNVFGQAPGVVPQEELTTSSLPAPAEPAAGAGEKG